MRKLFLGLLACFILQQYALAQGVVLKGIVKDTSEKKSLFNAVVSLVQKKDSILVNFTRTNKEGQFRIEGLAPGKYLMLITYPKFADFGEEIEIQNTDIDLGNIALTQKSLLLKEVIVRTGQAIRIKGDTTEFTADSFIVKEGATVEDLLKVLPGFQVNSKGEITAQGKRVEKVLVDGEEFFGDDPTMATQNLSSKIVDKVQVFDTKTEQQNLTGIQTGNEGKTVNIKLKEDKKKGAFGKLIAGSDFNEIVDAKGLYNRFTGKKKVAVYGTISDISTGSLNWEDQQKLGLENDMEYDEIGGYYYSFGTSDEFSEWSLRGLPHAYTAGGLFSNKWNDDKQNINTSYRYNRLNTDNDQSIFTQSTFPFLTNTNKYTKSSGINEQHAVTGKYEWKLDSLTSLKLTTSGIYKTTGLKAQTKSDYLFDSETQQKTYVSDQSRDNDTRRLQNDNSLQYKQLFKKKNRQLLATFRYGITEDEQEFMLYSNTNYFTNNVLDSSEIIDQMKDFDGRSRTVGGKLTFSEPLSSKWNLVLDYAHNRNNSESYRNSFNKSNNGKYEVLDAAFSNNFDMNAYSHSGLAILRFMDQKLRYAFGSGISTVRLKLNNLDNNVKNDYDFLNLTPQAQISYQLKQQESISFNYRGTTRHPTIDQLQPIRNNNDPLYEMIGNPNLKVAFNHRFSASYNHYKVLSRSGLFANISYNFTDNAIANSNTIDPSGKRTSMPINVDGNHNWNFWSQWNKGQGEKKLNFGAGLNGNGGQYNSFVNTDKTTTNYKNLKFNFNLNYSSPDKYSFEFRPEVGRNSSKTISVKRSATNNYFTYGGFVNGFVMLPGKLELTSNANFDLQQSVEGFGARSNIILWNASLARKIFKDKSGKIFLVANDLLDQNKGFNRNISSSFISEERFSRISRYFLLKFEWSFNKMPGTK
ncbi:MAG TPA: outer membrane beta-barrel protein [Chitinophagaceae bacterium]|nr:outer membrane beta-barrel protein [Chitinophagaceae bacterium]